MKTKLLISLLLAALGFAAIASSRSPGPVPLVAHEWGTFTAVVGSDGFEVPWWTPTLEGPGALPEFVKVPAGINILGKTGTGNLSLIRMETPVIYFYSPKPADLGVVVDSSQVRLTEVYPSLAPFRRFDPGKSEWKVRITPPSDPIGAKMPVVGERGHHYAHAREVPEASWVTVSRPDTVPEVEKFIFYRGTGNVTMPKRVYGVSATGPLLIPSKEPLFLVEVDHKGIRWKRIEASREEHPDSVEILRPALDEKASSSEEHLAGELAVELESAGLTAPEALAMVKTWREAWLGEPGLRLLEILPRKWVDQVLPLRITPAPTTLERVFVARWELLTPETEAKVLEALELTATPEEKIERLKELDLRRFGGAAFERAAKLRDDRFRMEFSGMISALNSSAPPAKIPLR